MSGGGARVGIDVLETAGLLGAHRTLEKPFSPEKLVETVQALLASDG